MISLPSEFRAHGTLGSICLLSGITNMRLEGLVLSSKTLLNPNPPTIEQIRRALEADRSAELEKEIELILKFLEK